MSRNSSDAVWEPVARPGAANLEPALEGTARLLEEGLSPLRAVRPPFRAALEHRLLAQLATVERTWWQRLAWEIEWRRSGAMAIALGAALAVLLTSAAARTPAVAEYWGQLVRQFGLREVAEPPPRPGVFRDAAGTVQELPIAVARQLVTFTLLVPRELPPGYDAGTGGAIMCGSSRASATLRYVERGAEARRWPAILVHEVAHSALAPPGRELPIKAGTAEAVRILARDAEPPDGLYVVGAWAYRSGSPVAEYTPALHSVSLDRADVRVFVQAVRSSVSKDQLIRVAASLEAGRPATAPNPAAKDT
ncbi:MAG: hypothetical protein ACR2NO_12695 [Chloroflexota bacterium]